MNWISVQDARLEQVGGQGFIAAIPVTSGNKHSWEIGHALIDDGTLYWVLPDTPLPELVETGWPPDSITHYILLPPPPA